MTRQEEKHWALVLEIRKAVLEIDGRYLVRTARAPIYAQISSNRRISQVDQMIDRILAGSVMTPEYIESYGISVITRLSNNQLIVV